MDFESIQADFKKDVERLKVLADRLIQDPKDVEALIEWGFLRTVDAFDAEEALEALNKALSLSKNNAEIYFWLAKTYYHNFFNLERTRTALKKGLEADSTRADCHDLLSEVLESFEKKSEQSLYHAKKAVELEPSWVFPRMRLISKLTKDNKFDEAEVHAMKAKELFENIKLPKPKTRMEEYYEYCVRGRVPKSKERINEVVREVREKRNEFKKMSLKTEK